MSSEWDIKPEMFGKISFFLGLTFPSQNFCLASSLGIVT